MVAPGYIDVGPTLALQGVTVRQATRGLGQGPTFSGVVLSPSKPELLSQIA
jgi:hypothetical protein